MTKTSVCYTIDIIKELFLILSHVFNNYITNI